ARAVRLALSAFSAILPSTMDIWVDNTSLQGAANKGSSKSHAMTWELQRIYEFLDSRGVQATFAYVRSAQNSRRRHITRSCVYTSGLGEGVELAKGSGGVLWLEDPKVSHFVSNNIQILTEEKGPCWWSTEFYILNEKKTLKQLTNEPFFLTCLVSIDCQDPASCPEDYSVFLSFGLRGGV
ncbi:protein kinase, partial [Trypanosoma cruzi]